jgi:hypothetical protein
VEFAQNFGNEGGVKVNFIDIFNTTAMLLVVLTVGFIVLFLWNPKGKKK